MDVGAQSYGVDHPEFGDAEAAIEIGFAAEIITEAGVRDLDDEQRGLAVQRLQSLRLRVKDEIRLEVSVEAQPERGFSREHQIRRELARPVQIQSRFHDFVLIALGRHWDELPA